MNIPLVDLKAQYLTIKDEIDNAISNVLNETSFIRGPHVANFEKSFAEKHNVKHCIGVGNGTDALFIILKCLGIGPGDEVITTALSWIATSEAITQTGAKVVFVDINESDFTIDTNLIEQKITKQTKAILPVHLYGQAANMNAIKNICKHHDLLLVEDCAQAHFAEYQNQKVGTFGIAGAFSFYPGKNLGAYGDGGAIITNDDNLADQIRMYTNHGARNKHDHEIEGINSRLDGLQAAILNVKLQYIDKWTILRQQHGEQYCKSLISLKAIQLPQISTNNSHVFHLYVIKTNFRDALMGFLKIHNIFAGIHYPKPLPLLNAYQYLNHTEKDFPIANQITSQIISLPMFPELSDDQIQYVIKTLNDYFSTKIK